MRVVGAVRLPAAIAALAMLVSASAAQGAETASQNFTGSGEHAFLVPAGVTGVQVTLVGGNGGAGAGGGPGGIPATAMATLVVSPGETLYAEVAGDGQSAGGAHNAGGYGGGGQGGERPFGGTGGGGGGGASDVRTCSASASPASCPGGASLLSRLLVAAGGGGGGGNGNEPSSTAGGNGGPYDQPGFAGHLDAHGDEGGSGGGRGLSSAGGANGAPSGACNEKTGEECAVPGSLGSGGSGGGAFLGGGGGGGGGIYGGGGGGGGNFRELAPGQIANGGGGGGGGGASGIPAGAAGVSGFSLIATAGGAEPSVTIAWTKPAPAAVTGAASAVGVVAAVLSGTVNPNGSMITDCHFAISPAPPQGAIVPCGQQVGAGSAAVPVSAPVTGLAPATAYTATLVAVSAQGSAAGAPVTFTTQPALPAPGTGTGSTSAAPPVVTNLRLSPTRFRRGRRSATAAARRGSRQAKSVPTATIISFTLSEAATVRLTFDQPQRGVLVGHRCTAPSKAHRRGSRCTRYLTVSHAITRAAHAGADRITFYGVLDGGSRLSPGTYRLALVASAGAARTSAVQHPTFTLLGP